ncbi:type VII secretion-associated protein [Pseudonocardia spinosispora]|uniref:type VII secretion-associated protein n=1 Tax=Pseudonocardia spinosispora TaxID=103441 RepID=UPI0003FFACB3|nr:type VII secretion-associated protein [Pseudonocardia spinosispora]
MRIAVRLGAGRVRVMSEEGPDRAPRLHPRAPASASGPSAVAEVLRTSGRDCVAVVLVHPSHWTAAAVRRAEAAFARQAPKVVGEPSAVCLVREFSARTPLVPGPLAVLEISPAGIGVTVLADRDDPRVLAGWFTERAEPLPALVAKAAETVRRKPTELTGGVLLSRIDAEGDWVAPDRAAVAELADLTGGPPMPLTDPVELALRGALRDPAPPLRGPDTDELPVVAAPPIDPALGSALLGPPPGRRRVGPVLWGIAVPVLVAMVTLLLIQWRTARLGPDPDAPLSAGRLSQYDYTFRLPEAWRHSGGLPQRRRTVLTPEGAPDGSDLISVEQTVLGYDSAAEPDRAVREFRDTYERSMAGGSDLSGLALSVTISGRDVIGYRQRQPVRGADVDWYVLFLRDAQISVGCQHTARGAEVVRAACADVVGSLQLRP